MSAAIIERAEPADAEARAKPQAAHTPDALNTVAISAAHLEAVMKVFAAMPESRRDSPNRSRALRQFARDAGFADEERVSAALHARITALSNWIERHDPHGQSDTQTVYEAAARFPLSALPGGFGFEPAGFQEMVLFIEDLPW